MNVLEKKDVGPTSLLIGLRAVQIRCCKARQFLLECAGRHTNVLPIERDGRTGNIGPRSWQYGPSAATTVQKRPRANIPQYSF